MTQENELERLEGFVAKILTEYNGLREEKKRLLQDLQEKEQRIADLEEELSAVQTERSDVGNRVKGLIQQIEAWESSLGEEKGDDQQTAMQDSRMQRNLFSVEPHDSVTAPELKSDV
jgi:predicted  nucleic acid-binding Zn-ribbon protein